MDAPCVLSVGYDPILMPIRTLLLRHVGYKVIATSSLGDALKKIKAGGFDLLLLCHTIPPDQQETLIAALHLARLGLPFLCLTPTPAEFDLADCPAGCSTAPEFLADVENALHRPPEKRAS